MHAATGRNRASPASQENALGTAFGLTSGARPDRFLVGLAVLSLLSDATETQPLVCLIDDAQWLDQSSAQVLAFVARRLKAESIVVVFAQRDTGGLDAFTGLPQLRLEGLSQVHARELLASAVRGLLDERVAGRIVAETHGNPLALLELPHGLSPAELAGGFGPTAALPLPGRIEESFRQRAERLPAETDGCCLWLRPSRSAIRRCCGERRSASASGPRQRILRKPLVYSRWTPG